MNLPISELVICETNVDAFISYCLRDIPVKTFNRMRLFLIPLYDTAMTCLDFGYYQFNNEYKPVKDYPDCFLMEMQGQALLQVHVSFPNMTELGLNLDSDSMALEPELQKKFIDKLFLPACKLFSRRALTTAVEAHMPSLSLVDCSILMRIHPFLLTLWPLWWRPCAI